MFRSDILGSALPIVAHLGLKDSKGRILQQKDNLDGQNRRFF